MAETFEEVSGSSSPNQDSGVENPGSLLRPIAWAAAIVYFSIVVFLPFILLDVDEIIGTVPLFFAATFFLVTLFYFGAWGGWVALNKKLGITFAPKLLLPLLAIPVSIGFFYLFAWTVIQLA